MPKNIKEKILDNIMSEYSSPEYLTERVCFRAMDEHTLLILKSIMNKELDFSMEAYDEGDAEKLLKEIEGELSKINNDA